MVKRRGASQLAHVSYIPSVIASQVPQIQPGWVAGRSVTSTTI